MLFLKQIQTDLTGKDPLDLEEEMKDFRNKYGQPSWTTGPSNK